MLRTSERLRLLTMIAMLGVLIMLIYRASDPATWKWFVQNRGPEEAPAGAEKGAAAASTKAAERAPTAPRPPDENPEQRAAAAEEFQAVTDGTPGIQPEEMFAYRRLLQWVERQSFAALEKRAKKNVAYNDFIQTPDRYRGRLVEIDLNLRRAIELNPADANKAGMKKLYELWGFSDESGNRLYDVVTAHLPEGMATGFNVEERGRFAGYFFKLQGYSPRDAKPGAALLRAPLLIGRLERFPPPAAWHSPWSGGWFYLLAGGLLLACLVFAAFWFFNRRKSGERRSTREAQKIESVQKWLREGFSESGEDSPPQDASGREV
jgi:hypothetical protein